MVAIFRSPIFNPSETFIQRQAAGLDRYRPLLVGMRDKGNIPPPLRDRILIAGPSERIALGLFGRAAPLAARLRHFAPALVHAHFATDGLAALPLARALGVALVTTLHGYDVSRSRAAMLLSGRWSWMRYALSRQRLIRHGHLFLAVSEALRRRALADGYPAERTLTHYLGVDLAASEGPGAAEPGLILHVGRLVEKKGTTVLLDAVAQLADARLVIVGDGPLRPALERQVQALGLADRVQFLGLLPPDAVGQWMRRAWLLAAPSVTARDGDAEGLPTVIKEAAAASLPTVGTDHAGIPEAVVDGETGFIVPERDVGALAARLGTLLASRDLQGRMAMAARRLAEERFDAARQLARLEGLYDEVRGQIRP